MMYNKDKKDKIKSLTDLNAYKEAHKLILMILLIAKDLKYLDQQTFNLIAQQSIIVRKLLSGLKRIKYQNETF